MICHPRRPRGDCLQNVCSYDHKGFGSMADI